MKVVVTSQGESLDSAIDPRFGRAKYFILVDIETGQFTVHDNSQNLNALQGAGIQSAQNVVNLGAEAVITGNVGPKAFSALQAVNMKICLTSAATVKEAVEEFKAGGSESVSRPNVQGHWT